MRCRDSHGHAVSSYPKEAKGCLHWSVRRRLWYFSASAWKLSIKSGNYVITDIYLFRNPKLTIKCLMTPLFALHLATTTSTMVTAVTWEHVVNDLNKSTGRTRYRGSIRLLLLHPFIGMLDQAWSTFSLNIALQSCYSKPHLHQHSHCILQNYLSFLMYGWILSPQSTK